MQLPAFSEHTDSDDEQTWPQWYDDPAFSDYEEEYCGITFKADAWRRLTQLKETSNISTAFSIAGTSLREAEIGRAIKHAQTKGGMKLCFVPEPCNKFDPHAIRVEVNSHVVGYVPKSRVIPKGAVTHVAKFGTCPRPHIVVAY